MPAAASGEGLNFLTVAETRTHFAAWYIVSSPLTLSHDLAVMDAVWPAVPNREALAVTRRGSETRAFWSRRATRC